MSEPNKVISGVVLRTNGEGITTPARLLVDIEYPALGPIRKAVDVTSHYAIGTSNGRAYTFQTSNGPELRAALVPKYPKHKLVLCEQVGEGNKPSLVHPPLEGTQPEHILRIKAHLSPSKDTSLDMWGVNIGNLSRVISLENLLYLSLFYRCSGFYFRKTPKLALIQRVSHTTKEVQRDRVG